jgi:hypothetical protein
MLRNDITKALADKSPAELWAAMVAHTRTLETFWVSAVGIFADRTSLPVAKRDEYIVVINKTFDTIVQWRSGTAKYVKARRNEIDSAISFLRNKAIELPNRRLRYAPASRNAAGALRVCLTTSAHGYDDKHLPELVAGIVYDVAAVRTLFPFYFGNLMIFPPGENGKSNGDVLDVALQYAGREFGIMHSVNALISEAERIWDTFDMPSPLVFPEGYWVAEGDDADVRLRSAAIATFHRTT